MEGERKRKGPLEIDWEKLLPSVQNNEDEEPPQVLVVTTTAKVAEQPQLISMGGEQSQEPRRDEFQHMKDKEINEMIARNRRNLETLGPKLPDKGDKLKATIKRLEDEIEHRKHLRVDLDADGCEKATQSSFGASDGSREEVPRPSQSSFASHFRRKLDENTDVRTGNAFEKELSSLKPCDGRLRSNGQFSARGRHKSGLSSRQTPYRCPSSLSVDIDKQIFSNDGKKCRLSPTCSPHHPEEDMTGFFSNKRNASQVKPSHNLRPKKEQTVVLVDEEEHQLGETAQEDKIDECMKETKIYYPSRDDPESVEICYSDMECLAPEAYLSSTIMNFYIRYLQQPSSRTDKAICDYHFFNTYFYKKLKEAVLNKRSDKETLFAKFRRWWKGVNIFEKAYIFLPIHENLHWSLVIICIPDKEDQIGPIVLHLDSLRLHFSKSIIENIKSFLKEEWNYLNQGEAPSDLPIADKIWQNLPRRIDDETIEVPQQKNEYDCGLFVLFFMERFIEEAPERLKKKDLKMFGKQWFKPEEASGLRKKVRKLLIEEFKNAKDKIVTDL